MLETITWYLCQGITKIYPFQKLVKTLFRLSVKHFLTGERSVSQYFPVHSTMPNLIEKFENKDTPSKDLEAKKQAEFSGPLEKRSCTDIPALVMFVAFLAGWTAITIVVLQEGDYRKLLHPTVVSEEKERRQWNHLMLDTSLAEFERSTLRPGRQCWQAVLNVHEPAQLRHWRVYSVLWMSDGSSLCCWVSNHVLQLLFRHQGSHWGGHQNYDAALLSHGC